MRAYRSAIAERASERVSTTHMSRHMRECGLITSTLLMSLLALALLSRLALAQGASFHIVSDSKAKYSYTEESGWETLSFNDSAWPFVVSPSAGLCQLPWPPPGPTDKAIWGENPQEFQTIFVRRTFTLDTAAIANIIVTVDDDYDLFINGVLIGGNHDGGASGDRYTDVPLQAGLNVLAIKAIDVAGGCQWIEFEVFPPPESPANDDMANAVVISDLDFTEKRDTRGATTAAEDPGSCSGGTNVWYVFTPMDDTIVRLTSAGSSYEAFFDVFVSSAGKLSHTGTCGWVQLDFVANAGTTYYFMVSSSFGGDLVFSALSQGRPFKVILSLDAHGSSDAKTGRAAISGTATCDQPAGVDVQGQLRQRLGRKTIIQGGFSTSINCDGLTPWSATASSDQGSFGGGQAEVSASASGCGQANCDDDQKNATVHLRGKQ